MNVVYCSTKLSSFLGVNEKMDKNVILTPTSLGSWNAHVFYFGGKKCLQFVNKKSIYSVTICHFRKTDLASLKVLFLKALVAQCKWEGFNLNENMLRNHFGKITFAKTDNDKRTIGCLNDLIYHAKVSLAAGPPAFQIVENDLFVFNMNQMPWTALGFDYPTQVFESLINSA